MRLRVALMIAQTIEYYTSKQVIINYLNPYNIFFDEDGNPRLSSYCLMDRNVEGLRCYADLYDSSEFQMTGHSGPASVVYSFGSILLVLLSGKEFTHYEWFSLIRWKKKSMPIDPRLNGELSRTDFIEVAKLATLCLQDNCQVRPKPETLVSLLSLLQKENEVPSFVLMGLETHLSPLGEACERKDLTAIHKILVNLGYKDDDGATSEDTIESKKDGDVAFCNRDFNAAINCYTKFIDAATMVSPTIHTRRSLSYLMINSPGKACKDAIKAQVIFPNWHIAYYLEAAALFTLGKDNEAQTALRKGSVLERKNVGTFALFLQKTACVNHS